MRLTLGPGCEMVRAGVIVGFLVMLLAPSGIAQEHEHGNGEKLGAVHFATPCNEGAQKEFDRAVALLHSFQFSRAIQGFNASLKSDATSAAAMTATLLHKLAPRWRARRSSGRSHAS